jgi:hypothetical protein
MTFCFWRKYSRRHSLVKKYFSIYDKKFVFFFRQIYSGEWGGGGECRDVQGSKPQKEYQQLADFNLHTLTCIYKDAHILQRRLCFLLHMKNEIILLIAHEGGGGGGGVGGEVCTAPPADVACN